MDIEFTSEGLGLRARALSERGFQDAGKRLISRFGEFVQTKLDGVWVVAEAERAEDSIPN